MKFLGAKIREQNVTFGIVAVKPYVLQNPAARENMQDFGVRVFGYVPIVLMAKNARPETPGYVLVRYSAAATAAPFSGLALTSLPISQ